MKNTTSIYKEKGCGRDTATSKANLRAQNIKPSEFQLVFSAPFEPLKTTPTLHLFSTVIFPTTSSSLPPSPVRFVMHYCCCVFADHCFILPPPPPPPSRFVMHYCCCVLQATASPLPLPSWRDIRPTAAWAGRPLQPAAPLPPHLALAPW